MVGKWEGMKVGRCISGKVGRLVLILIPILILISIRKGMYHVEATILSLWLGGLGWNHEWTRIGTNGEGVMVGKYEGGKVGRGIGGKAYRWEGMKVGKWEGWDQSYSYS